MELVSKKILSATIFLIVLVIIIVSSIQNVRRVSSQNFDYLSVKGDIEMCDIAPDKCFVNICDEKSVCSSEERDISEKYLNFYYWCRENMSRKGCNSVLFEKIEESMKFKDSEFLSKFDSDSVYEDGVIVGDVFDTSVHIKKNIIPEQYLRTYIRLKDIKISLITDGVEFLEEEAIKNGINPLFAFFVLNQESFGNFKAISQTGCVGLFQFCYGTAFKDERFSSIFGIEGKSCRGKSYSECKDDPRFDPEKSIIAGTKYLGILAKQYNGNPFLILTAYNAGPKIANQCKDYSDLKELKSCILEKTQDYYNDPLKVSEVKSYLDKIIVPFNVASVGVKNNG